MVPNGPFLEKWTMLILGSAVHHNFRVGLALMRARDAPMAGIYTLGF